MAAPDSVSIVSQVSFRLKVQNVSQLKEVTSPKFVIQDIPWYVRLTKTVEEAEEFLAIYLCCENKDKSPEWTQPAAASFKLLPFNGNSTAKEYHLEPNVFDRIMTSSGCSSICWADLFDAANHYVKNDAIDLEVSITVADPNDEYKSDSIFDAIDNCCDSGRVGTFRLTVNNIENLMAIRSSQFMLRDVPWYLTVFKHSSHLGLRLDARDSSDEIICNVSASVKISSLNEQFQRVQKIEAKQVQRKDGLVMERLITWDDLMRPQNGHIDNGSVTLEIEINAERRLGVATPCARKRQISNESAQIKMPRMECPICNDAIEIHNISFIPCGHTFCTPCITNSVRDRKACPIVACSAKVQPRQVKLLRLPIVSNSE
ncbi:uncharacterized protein LOC129565537 [Sitodiplosis mosellana]|uniref:uncharacterized protein LOC129565537 n=1 Tax=Sitodiplosis mosellana TaxID=263140 RepID=UPI0024452144|nr:uncharacterized protein LOC129565537 [Sitodiplosis mosellana]